MVSKRYLERIGISDRLTATYENLELILKKASEMIPFENLDVHLGYGIDLTKERIENKILDKKRGGYCYEVNGILSYALEELGFDVSYMGARTIFGYNELRPITHMVLKVKIENSCYLCDLGFTGMNSIKPLLIHDNENNGSFRLLKDSEVGNILQVNREEGSWESLYSFTTDELRLIDFELANYYNSNSEKSICTRKVICSINNENGSTRLVDNELKVRNGKLDSDTIVKSKSELYDLLNDLFCITLTAKEAEIIFNKIDNQRIPSSKLNVLEGHASIHLKQLIQS